jgi:Swiss Army Knife RNA repair-like protein
MPNDAQKPILFLDVDGVISLFGFREGYGLASGNAPFEGCPPGSLHSINGVIHYISTGCAAHLERLGERYELVWASGWEDTANEYLPHLLGLPGDLPCLTFDGRVRAGAAHWKIEAIDEYADGRPLAWIDDNVDDSCRLWAAERAAPTLIIETVRHEGMHDEHVELLMQWADELTARP